jgi:hypothetical protein
VSLSEALYVIAHPSLFKVGTLNGLLGFEDEPILFLKPSFIKLNPEGTAVY